MSYLVERAAPRHLLENLVQFNFDREIIMWDRALRLDHTASIFLWVAIVIVDQSRVRMTYRS